MKLTWLGHACFLLEEDGYRIDIGPVYRRGGVILHCTYRPTPFFAATAILTITPQTVWSCCQSGKARLRSGR